jgi:hypothetical protein
VPWESRGEEREDNGGDVEATLPCKEISFLSAVTDQKVLRVHAKTILYIHALKIAASLLSILIQVFDTIVLPISPLINTMQSEAQTKFLEDVRSEWEAAQTTEDATKVFSKLMDADVIDEWVKMIPLNDQWSVISVTVPKTDADAIHWTAWPTSSD